MLSTTSPARRSRRSKRSGANTAPVDFDAADHPILAAHWFDIEPPTPRPANEPDGFVLFDSKRDYLNQIDAYREWQRR